MLDPVSGAALGAAGKAADSVAGEVGGLLARVFGPAADEMGEAFGRYTSYRVGNATKIVEAASRKNGPKNEGGQVPPRLAHSLLDAGSYCDDEVMVDYLGGVLAGGRTPSGRDDRAVSWSNLITQLSAAQLRTHYLLYTAWIDFLREHPDVNPATDGYDGLLYLDTVELVELLGDTGEGASHGSLLSHAVGGLGRTDLISPLTWGFGPPEMAAKNTNREQSHLENLWDSNHLLWCVPSMSGFELWAWAHGLSEFDQDTLREIHDDEPITGPLQRVAFAYDRPKRGYGRPTA